MYYAAFVLWVALNTASQGIQCPPSYAALSAKELSEVDPVCMKSLTALQLSEINPEACSGFTAAQIANVATEYPFDACRLLTGECLANVPVDSIKTLTTNCITQVTTSTISKLTQHQLSVLSPKSAVAFLNADQLSALNASVCAQGFTSDQVAALGSANGGTDACRGLSLDCLNKWESGVFSKLQGNCVANIDAGYFGMLNKDSVLKISPSAILGVSAEKFFNFIHAYGVDVIDAFSFEQLKPTPVREVEAFHKYFASGDLKEQADRTAVVKGSLNRRHWLQLSFSAAASASEISGDSIRFVNTDVPFSGLRGDHAHHLAPEVFQSVSHLPVFSGDFISELSDKQVAQVACLGFQDFFEFPKVSTTVLQSITPKQWDALFNSVEIARQPVPSCDSVLKFLSEPVRKVIANYSTPWASAFKYCAMDPNSARNFSDADSLPCVAAHHPTEEPTPTFSPTVTADPFVPAQSVAAGKKPNWILILVICSAAAVGLVVGGVVYNQRRVARNRGAANDANYQPVPQAADP